jgi:hypothetical protein
VTYLEWMEAGIHTWSASRNLFHMWSYNFVKLKSAGICANRIRQEFTSFDDSRFAYPTQSVVGTVQVTTINPVSQTRSMIRPCDIGSVRPVLERRSRLALHWRVPGPMHW